MINVGVELALPRAEQAPHPTKIHYETTPLSKFFREGLCLNRVYAAASADPTCTVDPVPDLVQRDQQCCRSHDHAHHPGDHIPKAYTEMIRQRASRR